MRIMNKILLLLIAIAFTNNNLSAMSVDTLETISISCGLVSVACWYEYLWGSSRKSIDTFYNTITAINNGNPWIRRSDSTIAYSYRDTDGYPHIVFFENPCRERYISSNIYNQLVNICNEQTTRYNSSSKDENSILPASLKLLSHEEIEEDIPAWKIKELFIKYNNAGILFHDSSDTLSLESIEASFNTYLDAIKWTHRISYIGIITSALSLSCLGWKAYTYYKNHTRRLDKPSSHAVIIKSEL